MIYSTYKYYQGRHRHDMGLSPHPLDGQNQILLQPYSANLETGAAPRRILESHIFSSGIPQHILQKTLLVHPMMLKLFFVVGTDGQRIFLALTTPGKLIVIALFDGCLREDQGIGMRTKLELVVVL